MHLSNVSQIINNELVIEYFQATLLMSHVLSCDSCFSLETKKELNNPEPSPSKSFSEIVTTQTNKNLSHLIYPEK